MTILWTGTEADVPAAELYNSLPQEEKRHFLAYNIAIVLEPNVKNQSYHGTRPLQILDQINVPKPLLNKYEGMELPEDVPTTLYNWIQRKGNFTKKQMFRLLRSGWICRPCVYLDNPGSNCCF
ncbi:uncharacterized protein [Anabrus simplex]|uniref:uncharacterized protein n=1 Tax=Anabrus simplex TaxID=316456 RepID=UPI0035A35B4D